jgi:hypothetical protein
MIMVKSVADDIADAESRTAPARDVWAPHAGH